MGEPAARQEDPVSAFGIYTIDSADTQIFDNEIALSNPARRLHRRHGRHRWGWAVKVQMGNYDFGELYGGNGGQGGQTAAKAAERAAQDTAQLGSWFYSVGDAAEAHDGIKGNLLHDIYFRWRRTGWNGGAWREWRRWRRWRSG